MRILELIPSLIDGGAERFILDISKEFIEQSHEVCIASLFPESEEGLKYFSDWDPQIERAFLDKKLGFDPKVILRLRKLIKEYRPDIIHTHLRVVNYLAIAKLMGGISQPIVHTVHNDAAQEVGSDKEQKFRHFLFKSGRIHPVSISGMSDDSFKKIYEGVDVHRIDNGRSFPEKTEDFHETKAFFDSLKSKFGSDCRFWINIGRIVPQKNQVMLVKAFQKLIDQDVNAVLLILGTERRPYSDPIVDEMKSYFGDRIQWLGGKPNATDYLHLADYFTLSSLWEGMPISLIEAMATSCTPVCTAVGGIPEMVGSQGFLSKSINEEDFLLAMQEASSLSNSELESRQADLKRKYFDNYGMKTCANKYLDYFNTLV